MIFKHTVKFAIFWCKYLSKQLCGGHFIDNIVQVNKSESIQIKKTSTNFRCYCMSYTAYTKPTKQPLCADGITLHQPVETKSKTLKSWAYSQLK